MRIALINGFFPPRRGGSSHLTYSLASALNDKNHEVLVLTATSSDGSYVDSKFDVHRLRSWKLSKIHRSLDYDLPLSFTFRNLRESFKILDNFRPDVINIHGQFLDTSWLGFIYARARRIPCLLTIHTRLESPNKFVNFIFKLIDKTLIRLFIRLARPNVVVMDRLMDEYISSRYARSVKKRYSVPVGVEVNDEADPTDPEVIRSRFDLGNGPIWLSIGHVIPVRDRLLCIESLPQILQRAPELKFVVVGDVFDNRFLDLAKKLNVSNSVVCLGSRNRKEIADLLRIATLESHDLQGYGLGTASLESMYQSVPVIAYVKKDNFLDVELRPDKDLLILKENAPQELAEAVIKLLEDPILVRELKTNGRLLVKQSFLIEGVVQKYEDIFHEMCNNKV
jgi:glycosyltransferase involved in cell wall biosynthesis